MPAIPHAERHFMATETVRDIVLGMADGLTVPFALAAGLSGAVSSTEIVVTAGMAEIAAGSIAMGLGGYLAAKTALEHYRAEEQRERSETDRMPAQETEEVAAVFRGFGLPEAQIGPVVDAIKSNRERWVDFMMRFELGLEAPDPARARRSAATIGGAYAAGGLIPLLPYILSSRLSTALWISIVVTTAALFGFGFVKGRFTGLAPLRAALQTVLTGGLAAGAAFAIARLIG